MKMVRKQIYITNEQDEKLKRLAQARGQTEAEVVRYALEGLSEASYDSLEPLTAESRTLREGTAVMDGYRTENATVNAGLVLDQKSADEAWQRELAFIKSLAEKKVENRGEAAWKFNRDELYEERLAKILRRH